MFLTFIHDAIRFSTVFLFGSTGETITEKSGHLNLGIPGIMCLGALGGCVGESIYLKNFADTAQLNPAAAVIIGILFSLLFAGFGGFLYGFLTITLRCNQNVSGLAITTFGTGVTNFFIKIVEKRGFSDAGLAFTKTIPGVENGGWFSELFLSYGCLVYIAFALAVAATVIFKHTRIGLHLRATGENPATADAAGINVTGYKYVSCVLGAAIAGLGGLFFIMDHLNGNWEYEIDAMGWLAVALVIFSLWRPNWGILGSILFAALYLAPQVLNVGLQNKELLKMLPFLVTTIILVVTSIFNKKETQPPAALGLSYFREER